ncbi:MAG: hypothetical protein P4N41_24405 [Negativicutes bacterium]|nr:hypothetical protein [Negativicutes bacterium]MDR3592813.1 hypothetical protein [Negativicutes bacterium]
MTMLTKGMVVLDTVSSPLSCPAKILFNNLGKGAQTGKTLFDVFIDDMSYGYFLLPGEITSLEEAQARLQAIAIKGAPETVAECAVSWCFVHVDDNDSYGEG